MGWFNTKNRKKELSNEIAIEIRKLKNAIWWLIVILVIIIGWGLQDIVEAINNINWNCLLG